MSNIEKYTQAFVDAFSIEAESAKALKFQDIPAWDSVGHMGLVAQLEEQFGIMMEPDDIVDLNSFEKGKEMLSSTYGIDFEA
jgi:acyl carrier protein